MRAGRRACSRVFPRLVGVEGFGVWDGFLAGSSGVWEAYWILSLLSFFYFTCLLGRLAS